ncbi:MAG: response regulator transcription factor [Bacteroidetes bacterium]|nr:response regulator transcription factor [Bacteroidota bacterium]
MDERITRTVVVDDERHVRETLIGMIAEYCNDIEVVAEAATLDQAKEAIAVHRPDLLFLDVEMPGGNGFDLLGSLPRIDFDVVFVSAYDHYALRAIKLSALDYILKPVDPQELERAVRKSALQRAARGMVPRRNNMAQPAVAHQLDRIAVPTEAGFEFVTIRDLIRCKAEGNYTRIFLSDGRRLLSSRTLGEFEAVLLECGFMRVHHSHLINLNHVRRYTKGRGGILEMADGAEVEVSVRRKEAFLGAVTRL